MITLVAKKEGCSLPAQLASRYFVTNVMLVFVISYK